jgi:hypothetical protein
MRILKYQPLGAKSESNQLILRKIGFSSSMNFVEKSAVEQT